MQKQLDDLLMSFDKDFGKGYAKLLNDSVLPIERTTSGSIILDWKIGGGFALGKITHIKGWEGAGKTTFMIHALAHLSQKHIVAYIDCEHALNREYLEALGMNMSNCIFIQPMSMEESIKAVEKLVKSDIIRAIGYDSVASIQPEKEIQGELSDHNIGVKAKLMSRFMRNITPLLNKHNVAGIFINQLRENPGVMFGNPETSPGGNALKFHAFTTLNLRRGKKIEVKGEAIGHLISVKCEKNKGGGMFSKIEIPLIYGSGVDRYREAIELAPELGILEKSGAWYSYEGAKIGQGQENVKQFFKDNPEVFAEVVDKIYKSISYTD